MKVPGNGVPCVMTAVLGDAVTDTNFLTSTRTAGASRSAPSASSATVLRMPYALIVAEPTSYSSGKVIPRRSLNAERISGGS